MCKICIEDRWLGARFVCMLPNISALSVRREIEWIFRFRYFYPFWRFDEEERIKWNK